MLDYLLLFLAGLGGGFLAGLLGIGGGIIYILVLPLALTHIQVPPQELVQYTIANSIFATAAASLSGNISLFRKKDFYPNEVLLTGICGVLASYLLLTFFVNTPHYSQTFFNIVVILILIFILFKAWNNTNALKMEKPVQNHQKLWYGGAGLAGGSLAALSGLGGGVIVVPLLITWFGMDIKKARSISLGMIFITSIAITVYNGLVKPVFPFEYQHWGYIVYPVAIALSAGVVIGSPLGVTASGKMSSRLITYIFIIFVAIVIIKKLFDLFS